MPRTDGDEQAGQRVEQGDGKGRGERTLQTLALRLRTERHRSRGRIVERLPENLLTVRGEP